MSVAAFSSDFRGGASLRRRLRAALPALSLALVVAAIAWLNPRAISYFGFTLMLNLAIPIALATVAQMFVMAGNDLDLSIGTFVGFACCVSATWLRDAPAIGALILLGCVGLYAALGALIDLRNLPSIVVTLGMSFVWQGLAILLLPKPGGRAPAWLLSIMGVKPPVVPFPILAAALIAGIAWFGLMRTSYGAILRGSGGNAIAIERAGWSANQGQGGPVCAGRAVRRAVGNGARRHHDLGRREYRQRLQRRCCRSQASFSAAGIGNGTTGGLTPMIECSQAGAGRPASAGGGSPDPARRSSCRA